MSVRAGALMRRHHPAPNSTMAPGNGGIYANFAHHRVGTTHFEIKFEANAPSDIYVAVMPGEYEFCDACYEVRIGENGNSESSIRWGTGGSVLASAIGQHIPNVEEFQAYWIALREHLLSVGLGEVTHEQTIMSVEVPLFQDESHLHIGFAGGPEPVAFIHKFK